MAINSIVVVAERTGPGAGAADLTRAFSPGHAYPLDGTLQLTVQDQPFPRFDAPTHVVPAIQSVRLSYGQFELDDDTTQSAVVDNPVRSLVPDEHWLRELRFSARYSRGSWHVAGDEATLDILVTAGLRDNTPAGAESLPDDPFVVEFKVQALCIWNVESRSLTDRLRGLRGVAPRQR